MRATRCAIVFYFFLSTLCPLSALAQLLDDDSRAGFRAITSALLAFSTNDSVSGGVFSIETEDPELSDTDLSILKTWVEIPLMDPEADFVPLLELSPAYLELSQDGLGGGLGFEVSSWGVGAGLGARLRFFDDSLEVTPRMKVEYSRLDYEVSSDRIDREVLDAFSPSLNTWTYIPSLEILLKNALNDRGRKALVSTHLSYLYVRATTSSVDLRDFSEKSLVWKNTVSLEEPVELFEKSEPVFFRPSFALVQLFGDARDGFDFNHFFESGLDVFSMSVGEPYFSELGFGIRYIFADEITGWRFGLFGDFS